MRASQWTGFPPIMGVPLDDLLTLWGGLAGARLTGDSLCVNAFQLGGHSAIVDLAREPRTRDLAKQELLNRAAALVDICKMFEGRYAALVYAEQEDGPTRRIGPWFARIPFDWRVHLSVRNAPKRREKKAAPHGE